MSLRRSIEKRIIILTTVDSVVEGTEQFSAVLTSTDDRVTVTEERADISILETGNGNIYCVLMDEGTLGWSTSLCRLRILILVRVWCMTSLF